jgi:hypothetical protein
MMATTLTNLVNLSATLQAGLARLYLDTSNKPSAVPLHHQVPANLPQIQPSSNLPEVPATTTTTRRETQKAEKSNPPADMTSSEAPKLLWNPENVKDVAESVGIANLNDEALRVLTQDVEYRVGQVIIEAVRFMRASRRTMLTVSDISTALKVLNAEPLYGYDSTRPLRYGEASLGPGQPLFYIEDEEIDFEKLINAPLPKVPRDMSFTGKILLFICF